MRPSSHHKRQAALAAAERQFLATGYESVTMESIAKESEIAKQTLYSYFGSKRALFLHLITAKTRAASRSVHSPAPRVPAAEARAALRDVLVAQLSAVMTPEILALRRLVIGERMRSPELAEALYEHGPREGISALTKVLADLVSARVLRVPDTERAATQLNWLVMGEPINRAMLLGDAAIPSPAQIRDQVDSALDLFFGAYGQSLVPAGNGDSRHDRPSDG